jgi:hypothetical protein
MSQQHLPTPVQALFPERSCLADNNTRRQWDNIHRVLEGRKIVISISEYFS